MELPPAQPHRRPPLPGPVSPHIEAGLKPAGMGLCPHIHSEMDWTGETPSLLTLISSMPLSRGLSMSPASLHPRISFISPALYNIMYLAVTIRDPSKDQGPAVHVRCKGR